MSHPLRFLALCLTLTILTGCDRSPPPNEANDRTTGAAGEAVSEPTPEPEGQAATTGTRPACDDDCRAHCAAHIIPRNLAACVELYDAGCFDEPAPDGVDCSRVEELRRAAADTPMLAPRQRIRPKAE